MTSDSDHLGLESLSQQYLSLGYLHYCSQLVYIKDNKIEVFGTSAMQLQRYFKTKLEIENNNDCFNILFNFIVSTHYPVANCTTGCKTRWTFDSIENKSRVELDSPL